MDRNELCELLDKGYGGRQITSLYTDRIDAAVRNVFDAATSSRPGPSRLCVVAVGGYGRGEMAPFSDVDIMLFARDRSASEEAKELLYRLWNTNLTISHSFRTPDDCIGEARKDIRTRTSLLEHRYIAGDTALYDYFRERVYPEVAFRNQKSYVAEKLREAEERYRKFGDSVFMLEPNVKEGKGGLRDAHAVFWLASVAFRIRHFDELARILTPYDVHRLKKAYDLLLKVRFALHILSGRKNETLSFEFHEPVADMLRFRASRKFFASERFMRYFYLKMSLIHDIASYALDICSLPYVHLPLSVTRKAVTPDFSVAKDRIVSTRDISSDTDAMMEAFFVMSKTGKKFSPRLRADIRKNLFRITRKARNSPKAVGRFMDIIGGNRIYETLNEMHRCGVLARFIPEFGALTFLVVYEPYHRYTVDEHSLRAVRRLEELGSTRYENLGHLSSLFRRMRNKEILVLSLLLHDIGKRGVTRESRFPESDKKRFHEGEGYMEIKNVMERFNIDIEARNRIEFLVKNHTLISTVAFKRESEDPEVIAQLADEVADRQNLDSLYLLTYADMAAVSPGFWTDWKGYLLRELYETASRYLEGLQDKRHERISGMFASSGKEKEEMERFLSIMPERYVLSSPPEKMFADYRLSREVAERNFGLNVDETAGGTAEITVGAWDRPGLFSKIVGVLSSMGMNIYRARVYTGANGLVIDRVQIANWEELSWEGIVERLEDNLRGVLVEGRAEKTGLDRGPRADSGIPGFYGRYVPFIELDNETSGENSIVEFFARDRLGLLYDATSLMHALGIDIISARINTESGLAHDIFSLQKGGGKMQGEDVTGLLMTLWERLR